ncbi:gamma-interferon-inducible lysosomal thiol reductase isoform X2 [Agrilus planipennis]|uniref:Gamma-interferon-inducible lysosomal thiol reductase isoform X2 n=1 Tax=Agrilus planipennis TaxID=224129 RepID=A0A1W4XNX6_AGRPL|nr:gamma-interferon-inducible lysosomal thiol reductase isoform X2 [Agrilus planipennis]
MIILYSLVCLLFDSGSSVIIKEGKLRVSIYYEVLCPDSSRFIREQFYPTYNKLSPFLDVDFVPYGKARRWMTRDGKWQFKCQHDKAECVGNKREGCVLYQTLPDFKKSKFVYCDFGHSSPGSSKSVKECTGKVNASWSFVKSCMDSPKGDEILAHFGDITDALSSPLSYVPAIAINGFYSPSMSRDLEFNFFDTICSMFDNKPDKCISNATKFKPKKKHVM